MNCWPEVDELLEMKHWTDVEGYLEPDEALMLAKLAADRECLEIGSFYGKSSVCIASTAKSLVCVDTFEADETGQTQTGKIVTLCKFMHNTRGYKNISFKIMSSQDYFKQLDSHVEFDMAFVDGFHEYSVVKHDIEHVWKHLRMGGILAVHDFGIGCGVPLACDHFGILPMDGQVISLAWKVKQ